MSVSVDSFHPELQPYAKQKFGVHPLIIPLLQKLMSVLYQREQSDTEVQVTVCKVPVRDGAELQGLLYTPVGKEEPLPCLLFFHGGGFAYNAAPHHFALARNFARALQWKVFLVDYRLAPKYRYPTAPNDCFDTYCWLQTHAAVLGVCTDQLTVCGDSAGGNLAAVICQMARDKKIAQPMAQMLLYPVTDHRMNTVSMKRYTDTPLCNSRDVAKYYKMYLPKSKVANVSYLSPLLAASYADLPPAYVEVAEFDCLRDEGLAYAAALRGAGGLVQSHEIKGAMHGYDIASDSSLVQNLLRQRVDFLKDVLENTKIKELK